jgi:UDPglucose 6-dehydrogenase
MKVGIIGLGKLGLPVAITMAYKGHDVMGYDISPAIQEYVYKKELPYKEAGPDGTGNINDIFKTVNVKWGSLEEVVKHSELIFVAVQTPHELKYEGITRVPKQTKDFDYSWLISACKNLFDAIYKLKEKKSVVIISTVLPGTLRREVLPLRGTEICLAYSPQFIAMGTVMKDYLNPEFNLCGTIDDSASTLLQRFYSAINDAPFLEMSLESAELSKVAYNVMIGQKITFANQMMEICHKLHFANADDVMNCLKLSKDRLISKRYLNPGMGDSGGCHPRDAIALSWLSESLNLKYDMFGNLMICRELQTEFLADIIEEHHIKSELPIMIYGYTYKAETNLTTGSCATLLKNLLEERKLRVEMFDPHVSGFYLNWNKPMLFFIGMNHKDFVHENFPKGSIIIDPWGFMEDRDGILVIRVGRNQL